MKFEKEWYDMAKTIVLHIAGEDPVLADLERQPEPTDNYVIVSNVRRRDGKDVNYLAPGYETILFPWTRITFIEFMPEEERGEVLDFFRLD